MVLKKRFAKENKEQSAFALHSWKKPPQIQNPSPFPKKKENGQEPEGAEQERKKQKQKERKEEKRNKTKTFFSDSLSLYLKK